MSSMLEQAIIDAEQLKNTAQKTAEETVVEKYQDEIREAVEKILEQDEDLFGSLDPTLEEVEEEDTNLDFIEELPSAQTTKESEVVTIDLDRLEELMAEEMESEGGLDASDMADREEIAEDLVALSEEDEDEELYEIDESDLGEVLAELMAEETEEDTDVVKEAEEEDGDVVEEVVDEDADVVEEEATKKKAKKTGGQQSGGGGYYDYGWRQMQLEEKRALVKEMKKAKQKVQLLEEKLKQYGTITIKLKEKLEESNLINAKLLYQNRILNSISLNERQKNKIAETISDATTVGEAKIIFETLQSAVGSFKKEKPPESLNEVVTRSSSAFFPRREEKAKVDPFAERMRILAGLDKK